jgi:hypothetical protein
MKNNRWNFPKVLLQKLLFTVLIGAGCFAVGTAFYMFSRDRITILLSASVLLCSLARAYLLYTAISKGKYETVEGTCVGISAKPFRKQRVIKIMDSDGIESTLRLGRQTSVKIGTRYRFYFTERVTSPLPGSEYLTTALSAGQLLGYEELPATAEPEE